MDGLCKIAIQKVLIPGLRQEQIRAISYVFCKHKVQTTRAKKEKKEIPFQSATMDIMDHICLFIQSL